VIVLAGNWDQSVTSRGNYLVEGAPRRTKGRWGCWWDWDRRSRYHYRCRRPWISARLLAIWGFVGFEWRITRRRCQSKASHDKQFFWLRHRINIRCDWATPGVGRPNWEPKLVILRVVTSASNGQNYFKSTFTFSALYKLTRSPELLPLKLKK
jgi:hypothetical protein